MKPTVSIEVDRLDRLMALAGELVLCRNQLLQAIGNDDRRLLENSGQRIDLVTSEIQEQIMRTRMQPIGDLFEPLARKAADVAAEDAKEVEVRLDGRAVELDKSILEAVRAPLAQLVEQAVQWAIESPAVRIQKGKPAAGQVALTARQEAGQVIIEVSDDGLGASSDAIANQAVQAGVMTEKQSLELADDGDKMGLVWLPALFEAADTPAALRQFKGMDGIKEELARVGGDMDMTVSEGRGKQVWFKLPLTLSIIPSQMVRLGEERFAIPQANLSELLRIAAGQVKQMIETVGGAPVIRLRGELLPVIDLGASLGIERLFIDPESGQPCPERRTSIADRRSLEHAIADRSFEGSDRREESDRRNHADSALNIAVVSSGKYKYGLVVDGMNDSEEIVVKPMGHHLKNCNAFAGATIMGDGQVALILDVATIGQMADLRSVDLSEKATAATDSKAGQAIDTDQKQSYLFFFNNENERFAVPLNEVARIEKVAAAEIETVGGSRVLKHRGGTLPVISLDETLRVDPLPAREYYQVICFVVDDREIGLLATAPIDAAEVVVHLDEQTLKHPGVLGSAVLMDQTTLVLDMEKVVRNTKPDFFVEV